MARHQHGRLQGPAAPNALLQQVAVATREVRPPNTLGKDEVPAEEDFRLFPEEADRTGGMPGGVDNLKALPADQQFALLEEEIKAHFGHVYPQHLGKIGAHLHDVCLFVLVDPHADPLFSQGDTAFHVVRVPVGKDDAIHIPLLNTILLHGLVELGEEGLQPGIDQADRFLGSNHVGIAVVRPIVPPRVGEELFVYLHDALLCAFPSYVPVRCSWSGYPQGRTRRSCGRRRQSPYHTHGSE